MLYIIQALRYTYHTERKAYPRLNDLINALEEELDVDFQLIDDRCVAHLLLDINASLHDINLPIQEDV